MHQDFTFQLADEEYENLRYKNSTSSWGGRRYNPYAFTEQGVSMLSSVLNSDRAIAINIEIIRTFVKLRQYAILSTEKNKEIDELRKILMLHIENTDRRFSEHDKTIRQIINALNNLIEKPKETKKIGFRTE